MAPILIVAFQFNQRAFMARKRLFPRHAIYVRSNARDAWQQANGDPERAKEIAAERLRSDPGSIIGAILLGLAIKLAYEIIMFWFNNRVSEPAATYLASEPGYRGYE